ncbi:MULTISPECIES: oxygenase MpaB family protein [unclassified Nocardioides]|uniref:oxygenase MpaB family protein n=1 Tax=unclassified Nocardioides TaxID=2615069 RepID=UPI003613F704
MTATIDRRRQERDVPVPAGFEPRRHLSGLGAQLAGPANVILQLSWPGVGYGVMNSRVHDGSAMLHPWKRARTTFTYLAVSMLGTDTERATYRRAVNGQHAQVVSRPEEPVQYRAMDPRLQTWVAACLYYGTRDIIEKMHGPMPEAEADALYAHCARFGTTLQMPADAWPATRAEFDAYWEESLAEVRIDPAVRDFLLRLTLLQNFPKPLQRLGPWNLFVTTGFLPPAFREAMGLPWNDAQQARFDRLMRRAGRVERALPTSLKIFPFNALLADLRLRIRYDRPLV